MPQRIALPPVAMRNAGGGDSAGMQRDCPELPLPWHGDRPLLRIGRKSHDGQVASRVDQGGVDPTLLQLLQGGIDGHAFRDASEVKLDADGQCHASAYRVYLNATPSPSWFPRNDRIEADGRKVIEGAVIAHPHQLIQQSGIVYSLC